MCFRGDGEKHYAKNQVCTISISEFYASKQMTVKKLSFHYKKHHNFKTKKLSKKHQVDRFIRIKLFKMLPKVVVNDDI